MNDFLIALLLFPFVVVIIKAMGGGGSNEHNGSPFY